MLAVVRVLLFVVAWLIPAVSVAQPITVEGTHFMRGGRPFHVTGANAAVMHGEAHRAAARQTLEAIAADGGRVVRIWALGEYPADARESARNYAFRIGEDGWVESSFVHLDEVLHHCRQLHLYAIIVLANRWGDFGGVSQYLRWGGFSVAGHSVPPLGLSAFWDCASCEHRYRAHVERVVGRVNSIDGRRYIDDPTIFAWELMNEAEAAGVHGQTAMLAWMERQAAFVHDLDPNHLVSAGHIGYARSSDRHLFRRVCALEGIDYCDSHAYPLRHRRVRSFAALERWIDDRVQLAHHVVGRPLLFGEIGVRSDRRSIYGRPPADWLTRFFARLLRDGAGGALVWTYLPSNGRRRAYGIYASGPRVGQTRDLRNAIAFHARRATRTVPAERNPRLGPERGDAPIFDPIVRIARRSQPHDTWHGELLHVDPRELARTAFEGTGTYDGEPGLPHFYGAGVGRVSYRFIAPPPAPRALVVRLHASSELPGAGSDAGPEDVSELRLSVDGVSLGTLIAPPDDGVGDRLELRIEAPRLPARRVRTLTIEADRGVCLYARDIGQHPTGIEIEWIR